MTYVVVVDTNVIDTNEIDPDEIIDTQWIDKFNQAESAYNELYNEPVTSIKIYLM